MANLLDDVEAFLDQHQLAPTRFGDEALGDRHFVRTLRAGRRVWPETERKIRTFMEQAANHCADSTASATEPSSGKTGDASTQVAA